MNRLALLTLAFVLSSVGAGEAVAETRSVSTVAQWDTAFTAPPTSGNNLMVFVTEDLSRNTVQGGKDAYKIFPSGPGWVDGMSILVDCLYNSLIWTGSDDKIKVVRVQMPGPPLLVDVTFRNCFIEDHGDGTNTKGVKFAAINGGRMEFHAVRSRGFNQDGDVFFRPDSAFLQWAVYDSHFAANGGPDGAHVSVLGSTAFQYNNMFRDNLFGDSQSWCVDWDATLSGRATTITSQGNQFYNCRGIRLEGVYLFSTGDYFNQLGLRNDRSVPNAAIYVGTETSALWSGVRIKSGVLDAWGENSTYSYLFDARSWEYIDVDLAAVPAQLDGIGFCIETGMFGPDGAIVHGHVDGKPGRISFRAAAPRSSAGKQCFFSEGDPNKFLTADAQTMCSGANGNGRCTGFIEGVGLGRWRVEGDELWMQPYTYNVAGDGASTGDDFCSMGPGGKVLAGLACDTAVEAQTGAAATCATTLTGGTYYDVRCVSP